ncbi:unnamed protein product, partial [Rotaria magnacalcarata]
SLPAGVGITRGLAPR